MPTTEARTVADQLLEHEAFYELWTPWYENGFDPVPDLNDDAVGGILLGMLGVGWTVLHHAEGHWVVNTLQSDGPSRCGETLGIAAGKALLAKWVREDG